MEQATETKRPSALSGWPMILGWLAMLIFALHASTHMVGAGDTWVAMACGRHFLNHGVDTVEPFSANSHKAGPTEHEIETWPGWAQWITEKVGLKTVSYWHPTGWVNQNWLTHVIFYWLTHESPFADAETRSFNTLVYWKFAIYILMVICIYYTGRVLGANPALSAAFACFAMFIGRSFFDVRPAGFSNLLVAVFLLVLVLATYRNILYIWLIVPVVVFWCNLHGGYVYAFIMLVPFTALNLLTSFSKKSFVSIGLKGVYHTIAAGFVSFLAMVVFNPFHLTNLTHTFVVSVSEHAKMWRTVNEWHPAFEWGNPVGTSFPFLVLYMLSIGLTFFWLYSRFLLPKFIKGPKHELDQQKKQFVLLSKIFGCAMAVFLSWAAFTSFSSLNLDVGSYFICAVFAVILLLSIYKNVHFIYLQVPLILLGLSLASNKPHYFGLYIYPFVLLPAYVIVHILASLFSKDLKVKPLNIAFVAGAAVAALILMMVLFNPFKFKLPLWHLGQFFNMRRMWVPRYEGKYRVNYRYLFFVLYAVNVVSVIVWLAVPNLRKLFRALPEEVDEQAEAPPYELPKIDLAIMAIAALTVYMAVQSRRFIPVAAIAACPVLAMFIDNMARTISAARNFYGLSAAGASQNNASRKQNRLLVPPMPHGLQVFFILIAAVSVVGLGTHWTLKFKCVYLDPWPTDPKLTSVFMRMTASDAKPFYALDFIRENNLQGKMFNYWTEGGFIGWGQRPDPNSGKTPLLLFMDGRAQAAYEPKAYRVWSEIMSGGEITAQLQANAKARKRKLNTSEYRKIGDWLDKQFRKHEVWAVLMPAGQFDTPLVRGLERHSQWGLVFVNNKQKLFVDMRTDRAQELFEGILTGKTFYPDEFSRSLMIAHILLAPGRDGNEHKQGFDFAVKAFELNPSQIPMQKLIQAARYPELRGDVVTFCRNYLDRFEKNRDTWAKQDGYHHRIVAGLISSGYLRDIARRQKDKKEENRQAARIRDYRRERSRVISNKRW
jgi:hypothetical protein